MKAVFGKTVYLGNEKSLHRAYVLFINDKITAVTQKKPDCKLLGEYEVITPAFIDAHCHIGATRAGEPQEEDDVNDEMDSLLFQSDILDSIVMEDLSLKESVEYGVLYSCVLPGSGNVIGGKCAIIRNFARNTKEAFMEYAGMKTAFGHNPKSTTEWKGTRASTRMGAVSLLRRELRKGQKTRNLLKRRKKSKDEVEPQMESIISILNRWERLRVHAHRTDDIIAALRLAEEFDLDIVIEHASNVNQRSTFELLRQHKVPIVYGPVDSFPYKVELKNETWKNARQLIDSGVKFTVMSDHPIVLQRNLFLQMRFFRRLGLSKEQCISKITKEAAEILRMDKGLGTLEKGKLASFVCWNGDPFSMESYPVSVWAEGKRMLEEK